MIGARSLRPLAAPALRGGDGTSRQQRLLQVSRRRYSNGSSSRVVLAMAQKPLKFAATRSDYIDLVDGSVDGRSLAGARQARGQALSCRFVIVGGCLPHRQNGSERHSC